MKPKKPKKLNKYKLTNIMLEKSFKTNISLSEKTLLLFYLCEKSSNIL